MKNPIHPTRLSALSLVLAGALSCALSGYTRLAVAQPVALQLPETVVTATRFFDPLSSVAVGASVLTADDIRASGASTVNEAIMRLLGVPGRQNLTDVADHSLDLRGFGTTSDSNQVVILDGQRLSEADTGGTRLAGIPIHTVERIEVLRGTGAVLYGEGATGGVIVITTQAGVGKARRNSASLQVGAGSYGLRDVRSNATLAAGAFSLDVAANKRRADNHRANFHSEGDDLSLSGQWSNDWLRTGLRYGREHLDTGLPGSLTAAEYASNPRQTQKSKLNDHGNIKSERTGVFAEALLGDWQIHADLGTRAKQLRSWYGYSYDYDVTAKDAALLARHGATWGAHRNTLTLGTDASQWTRNVLGTWGTVAHRQSRAMYAKDELVLGGSQTRLSAGLRAERIKKDASDAPDQNQRPKAWELGLSQAFDSQWSAYARVGNSFRLPNMDEFNWTPPGVTLKTQTSRDTELGGRYSYASGKAELRLYRSSLQNELGQDLGAADPFNRNVNFDPTRRQGVELDWSHQLDKTLTLRMQAAHRSAQFLSGNYSGKTLPLVAKQTAAIRGDWRVAENQRLSGGVNWVGSQHPDFKNQCSIPAYTTADARYAYQWDKLELSVNVNNLFDRKFYTQAFDCTAGVTTSIYPEAGRAVGLTARLAF